MRYVMIAMAVLALYPVAASATPVAPEDLYKLTLLSNAAISPDGAPRARRGGANQRSEG